MEATFWINSWDQGGSATSFHRPDIHPYVMRYFTPEVLRGKRVLVPLCGKTNDMLWFRDHAEHVIGVELVPTAIHQFFAGNGISYQQTAPHRYEAEGITMLNMDFFDVTTSDIGKIDFIYDRAALVALPIEMRMRYIQQIDRLMPIGSEQLVITLEYAPFLDTPPFSITPTEMAAYYGTRHAIEHVEAPTLPGHRMVEKFNLAFLKEHGFWLRRRV